MLDDRGVFFPVPLIQPVLRNCSDHADLNVLGTRPCFCPAFWNLLKVRVSMMLSSKYTCHVYIITPTGLLCSLSQKSFLIWSFCTHSFLQQDNKAFRITIYQNWEQSQRYNISHSLLGYNTGVGMHFNFSNNITWLGLQTWPISVCVSEYKYQRWETATSHTHGH